MHTEGGFTLIEVMAALVVLTVAMTGLAGAVIGGLRATQVTQFRSAALELAKDRLEALRTVDWEYLGHYEDEAAWDTGFHDGESLVSVGATTPSPRPPDVPSLTAETVTVKEVDYSISTHVTWLGSSVSDPNDGTTYAQKRMAIDVTYTVRGNTQTVHLEGLRAPNAREMKPAGSASVVAINIVNSSVGVDQTLDVDGYTTQELTFLADTDVIADSVTAVYELSTGESVSVDLTGDPTGKYWSATVPIGAGPFAAGTTTVTFAAAHSSGSTTTASETVQFDSPSVTFALTDASVTIPNAQMITGYYTQADISLSVKASSTAASMQVTYPLQGGTTSAPVPLTFNGTAWVGTIASGAGPMTPGNVTFTFSGTALAGTTATTTASLTLAEPTLGAISILTPTVSPAFDVNNSNGKLSNNTTVTVEILNIDATGNSVTIKVGGLATQNATALGTIGPSGGQLFKITVAKNANLGIASPTSVVINVTRAADGATATGTYSFPVI
jgi:prepilin-type N-terminal cleavage/methylation domain-containing protein